MEYDDIRVVLNLFTMFLEPPLNHPDTLKHSFCGFLESIFPAEMEDFEK